MMQNRNETIQTLIDLGLTLVQAKTYTALTSLDVASAKAIAKLADIASQEVYRNMPTLQELGLVEKIIANPTLYRATSIKDGISSLLQRRKIENERIERKAMNLLFSQFDTKQRITIKEEKPQSVILSEKDQCLRKFDNVLGETRKKLCIFGPRKVFLAGIYRDIQKFVRLVKQGVQIRIITENCDDNELSRIVPVFLQENSLFEIRRISSPAPNTLVVSDDEITMFYLSDAASPEPSLCSTNPALVNTLASYFEELWNKSSKIDLTKANAKKVS